MAQHEGMTMNERLNGLLNRMISREEPLGPIATPHILQKSDNKRTFASVFDAENFLCLASKESHPSIVLGRRGAGKTAYLYYLQFEGGFSFASAIESAQAFQEIAGEIGRQSEKTKGSNTAMAETTAKIWRTLLFTAILKKFWSEFHLKSGIGSTPEMENIETFLEKSGIKKKRSVKRIFGHLVSTFESLTDKSLEFVEDFLDDYWWHEVGFEAAWEDALVLMEEYELRGAILIDSLEQYPIHEKPMADAMAGLLHFIGKLDQEYIPIEITMCFQAELHSEFSELSSNPEKDLAKVLSMHWDPIELLQICGHRFSIFINKERQLQERQLLTLSERPSRDEILEFWNQFLPEKLSNRFGDTESSIAYILRHTQLLPRHMISIFNQIVRLALSARDISLPFDEDDIIRGVRIGEENICLGAISGFQQKYPMAREVLSRIAPNIPNLISFSDLQRANNHYGKGIMESDELLQMFVRMGVLGKLNRQTEFYDICDYDYTFNGSMPYSVEDQFGLHPAFAGQYGAAHDASHGGGAKKPVYPREPMDEERKGVGFFNV